MCEWEGLGFNKTMAAQVPTAELPVFAESFYNFQFKC